VDPDPDPAYHVDADPDPTFQYDADPQHWFFEQKSVFIIVMEMNKCSSSYYKKILSKQHEVNAGGDSTEYLHTPRSLYVWTKFVQCFIRKL
jgi:hypothetical protein